MLVVLYPVLANTGNGVTWKEVVVIGWGGLRGAVGLALAIYFENNKEVDEVTSSRRVIVTPRPRPSPRKRHVLVIVIVTARLVRTNAKHATPRLRGGGTR